MCCPKCIDMISILRPTPMHGRRQEFGEEVSFLSARPRMLHVLEATHVHQCCVYMFGTSMFILPRAGVESTRFYVMNATEYTAEHLHQRFLQHQVFVCVTLAVV